VISHQFKKTLGIKENAPEILKCDEKKACAAQGNRLSLFAAPALLLVAQTNFHLFGEVGKNDHI